MNRIKLLFLLTILTISLSTQIIASSVKIGLNYPETGPYSIQGLDQKRGALLAAEEINKAGGILGKQVELLFKDSKSKVDITKQNVTELLEIEKCQMIFGGSSSAVAIAAGKVCKEHNALFFGTLTYSNATTGTAGHKYIFRECNNSWMAAKAVASYLNTNYSGKKFFYITADYTWGWTTEESVRKFSNTTDDKKHRGIKTPFPGATKKDFRKALSFAKILKPDVLVLVLFGKDMSQAIRIATSMGLKKNMQIVVPNITLGMAEGAGAKVMENVIGALPWTWQIPYKYNYKRGIEFVENFADRYNRYPSTSGGSAYTILWEYKNAVERAGTFETIPVIKALENHKYTSLKDSQIWRKFDHQSTQTVYAVKCKQSIAVKKDKFQLDYFEIINKLSGSTASRTFEEWSNARESVGKPTYLEGFKTSK
jgi:branched-chain amino acid transport system substrate-binding protein